MKLKSAFVANLVIIAFIMGLALVKTEVVLFAIPFVVILPACSKVK